MKTISTRPVESIDEIPPDLLEVFHLKLAAIGHASDDDAEIVANWNCYVEGLSLRNPENWPDEFLEHGFFGDDSTDGDKWPLDEFAAHFDRFDDDDLDDYEPEDDSDLEDDDE